MAQRGQMMRSLSQTKIAKALAGVGLEQSDVVKMDEGKTARREGRCVFECSWEVANKVITYNVLLIDFNINESKNLVFP